MFYKIIIWRKPDNTIYHKRVNSWSIVNYEVGYKNQYKHEVIYIFDLYVEFRKPHYFLKSVLRKLISFLQNILRRL